MLGGSRSIGSTRMRFTLICVAGDRGLYCKVVETKQTNKQTNKTRLEVREGVPEADRKQTSKCPCMQYASGSKRFLSLFGQVE